MLKNDINYMYDIEPVMNLDSFVELLLVLLVPEEQFYSAKKIEKIASLSFYYKQIIQDIMYCDGFGIKFSELIDIYQYYEEQVEWEEKLSLSINNHLRNRNVSYNIVNDCIEIRYNKKEIESILNKYDDESISLMTQFINLMKSSEFDRMANLKLRKLELRKSMADYEFEANSRIGMGKEKYEELENLFLVKKI